MESMEMEVMEARLIRASELNGEMEDDDSGQWDGAGTPFGFRVGTKFIVTEKKPELTSC